MSRQFAGLEFETQNAGGELRAYRRDALNAERRAVDVLETARREQIQKVSTVVPILSHAHALLVQQMTAIRALESALEVVNGTNGVGFPAIIGQRRARPLTAVNGNKNVSYPTTSGQQRTRYDQNHLLVPPRLS